MTIEITGSVTRQKHYKDLFETMLHLATIRILGTVSRFVVYWESQELSIPNSKLALHQGKSDVPKIDSEATIFSIDPQTKCTSRLTELEDSLYWNTFLQRTGLLYRGIGLKLLTGHSTWLRRTSSMSSPSTTKWRQQSAPRYIWFQ